MQTRLQYATVVTFGERLRVYREKAGMKQSQLAIRVGVTEGAIRQMESGQTRIASLQVGLKLAIVLGVDPIDLAFDERPNVDAPKRNGYGISALITDFEKNHTVAGSFTQPLALRPDEDRFERLEARVDALTRTIRKAIGAQADVLEDEAAPSHQGRRKGSEAW